MLIDDILLEIFEFCRIIHWDYPYWRPRPVWNWWILVRVCRRWRQIIFDSPSRLDLRILCKYGTPVRKNLGIWPAFPIVLQYCSPRSLNFKDEDNAIAALEHRDRVKYIRLYTTGSQLGRMAAVMQGPFPVLSYLHLRSSYEDETVLTAGFLGGSAPHLQEIILDRISFPALPTLLSSTSDLVTLNLFDIAMLGYILPERMVDCLAALPKLELFGIRFQLFPPTSDRMRPPLATRPVLPALTTFSFQGAFEYLEDLVAQIDGPQLERVSINYLDQPNDFQVMQLSEFIDRSIGYERTPFRRAHVRFQFDRVTFTLSREYPHESYLGCDRRSIATTISPNVFNWQMSDAALVLGQFSAALRTVIHLELKAELYEDDQSDAPYDIELLRLLRQFPAMQTLYVSPELAAPVYLALEDITAEMVTEMLPSLGLICLEGELTSSLEKIVAIRRFSDHPITVVETRDEFNERLESYLST